MARYRTPSPGATAAFDRAITAAAMRGPRSNPGARTIKARRTSTCPISDEKIEVGDSITKTESGWALTKYVRAAKSNPGHEEQTEHLLRLVAFSDAEGPNDEEYAAYQALMAMGYTARQIDLATQRMRAQQAKSNPSAGGRAMKYARAHGVPLKQGWAAVKAGKANPYYENPSMGGRAMQYSRAHGVSLKEGWKAVKSGRA